MLHMCSRSSVRTTSLVLRMLEAKAWGTKSCRECSRWIVIQRDQLGLTQIRPYANVPAASRMNASRSEGARFLGRNR